MQKIVLEITMSLDGFIAGTGISEEQPMGRDGELLHDWLFDAKTEADSRIIENLWTSYGAVILGNTTYSIAISKAWNGSSPFKMPALVLCGEKPKISVDGFTYHTKGIYEVLEKAKAVAEDKNVWIMGGANTARQFIKAGLLDELHIHIAPMLLTQGARLFDHISNQTIALKKISVIDTPAATHISYEIIKH